jgi:putative addiction module component (TIGR02574 family)
MSSDRLRRVLALANELAPAERAELADELLCAIPEADAEAGELDGEWIAEIGRRVAEIDSGAVKPIPADEVHAAVRAAIGQPTRR